MLIKYSPSTVLIHTCLAVLVLFSLAACSTIGPATVPQDQFDYNAAIAESDQQQLLTNLVRLRYSETPNFMKVSSVISQYTRSASVNAGVGVNTGATGQDTGSIGGRATWADRPTITYVPISGQEFSRNLLTPLPPGALFEMMQSGWPAELVIRMTMWSINDLDNDIARPSRRRQADPDLYEMFDIWKRLRQEGSLGLRRQTDEEREDKLIMFLRPDLPTSAQQDVLRFRELLNLDADISEFAITYGLIPEQPGGIAVLSGSIWDIMLNLAWQFHVPLEHVEEGRTGETFLSSRGGGQPPIEVHFSKDKPEGAFVAVFAHDYWFYISQRDRLSKRIFSFLQLLVTLAETGVPDRSPVVTISN